MSYCGICGKHDVISSRVKGGFYCSGCDEIYYYDDIEKEEAERSLRAIRSAKAAGWKIYPNWEEFGEPIDEVLRKAEIGYNQLVEHIKPTEP
jgi:hypothetical protein